MAYNTIVSDDYIEAMKTQLQTEADQLFEAMKEFVEIMGSVSFEGITDGKTSEAITAFTNEIVKIRDVFSAEKEGGDFGYLANLLCDNFLTHVDDAGRYLY